MKKLIQFRFITLLTVVILALAPMMLKAQSAESNRTSRNPVAAVNSANPYKNAPKFSSSEERDAWYRANVPFKIQVIHSEDPNYPVMVLTGNTEADEAHYQQKKAEWYGHKEINKEAEIEKQVAAKKALISQMEETRIAEKRAKKEAYLKAEAEKLAVEAAVKEAKLKSNGQKIIITKAEFDELPANKQKSVMADPNFIIIR